MNQIYRKSFVYPLMHHQGTTGGVACGGFDCLESHLTKSFILGIHMEWPWRAKPAILGQYEEVRITVS